MIYDKNYRIAHRLGIARGWMLFSICWLVFVDAMFVITLVNPSVDFVWNGLSFYDSYFWAFLIVIGLFDALGNTRKWERAKLELVKRTNVV